MGLSCTCGDYDPEPGDEVWYTPKDYTPLAATRAKRCTSCGELIPVGSLAGRVTRAKIPQTEIERRIYGEDGEVPLAPHWMCERCTDLLFSLEDLGFCVIPYDDMRELVVEYAALKEQRSKQSGS